MHVHVHVHVPAVYTRPYQAALNRGAFGVLRRRFGCELECFASALNCRYERYCSAFPDVDAPFGAAGDFFASDFDEGSFEANPPFVPALIGAMDLGCMPRLLPVDIGIPLDASACTTDGRGSHGWTASRMPRAALPWRTRRRALALALARCDGGEDGHAAPTRRYRTPRARLCRHRPQLATREGVAIVSLV